MTRSISSIDYLTALQKFDLVSRDFVWFVARDRSTGDPVTDGYWSDTGKITASVINPDTGAVSSRQWFGAGTLIQTSDIPLVSNLTIQTVSITLSQVSDRVNNLLRTYDCRRAKVELYRGLFDKGSRVMVAPAEPRFVGFIDEAPIKTPKEGEIGDVTITCTSKTQEMARSNPDTRSDASQRLRSPTDNFLQDVVTVGTWEQWWGREGGPVRTSPGGFREAWALLRKG